MNGIKAWDENQKFQSPIYGSRTQSEQSMSLYHSCFNPLSTGHAPVNLLDEAQTTAVSIPYLRVTHLDYLCP